MKTVAIIQARMGSTRLPGKVLKPIMGKPMLQHMVERVRRAKTLDQIIIATSTKPADTPISQLAKKLNLACFHGSETDVLSRYYQAAKKFSADIIVRLTGDCPLIDPAIIDAVVNQFKLTQADYTSNVLERTYPRGMDTEVFSFATLKLAQRLARSAYNREHVTPFIYTHPQKFHLGNMIAPKPFYRPDLHLTVDDLADFALVMAIFHQIYPSRPHFALGHIIALLDRQPMRLKTTLATRADLMLAFSLSNDPLTRQMSFSQHQIRLPEHLHWFNRLIKSPNRILLIIQARVGKNWVPIGQVRYDNLSHQISLSLSRAWRGKKLAVPALLQGIKAIKRKFKPSHIVAHIKPDNPASLSVFTSTGFYFDKKTTYQHISCLRYLL